MPGTSGPVTDHLRLRVVFARELDGTITVFRAEAVHSALTGESEEGTIDDWRLNDSGAVYLFSHSELRTITVEFPADAVQALFDDTPIDPIVKGPA